jgi:hypothetical protein
MKFHVLWSTPRGRHGHAAGNHRARVAGRLRSRPRPLRAAARRHRRHPERKPEQAGPAGTGAAGRRPPRRAGLQHRPSQRLRRRYTRGALHRCVTRAAAGRAGRVRAGRQHAGGGLHGRRADARTGTPVDPEGRRPRPVREQRASGGTGAPGARRHAGAAGQGPRQAPARCARDARELAGRHRAHHLAAGRHLRRQLGLHQPSRHHDALARGPGTRLPGGRQRERHAGARCGWRTTT